MLFLFPQMIYVLWICTDFLWKLKSIFFISVKISFNFFKVTIILLNTDSLLKSFFNLLGMQISGTFCKSAWKKFQNSSLGKQPSSAYVIPLSSLLNFQVAFENENLVPHLFSYILLLNWKRLLNGSLVQSWFQLLCYCGLRLIKE